MHIKKLEIVVYTDGSYSPQYNIGAWAALLLIAGEHILIDGVEKDTSHNRMELAAVISSIEYIVASSVSFTGIVVVTDSQYVAGLPGRNEKLTQAGFRTRKGNELRNTDLVRVLLDYHARYNVTFKKVKAHQPETETINYNREIDKRVRALLRKEITMQAPKP